MRHACAYGRKGKDNWSRSAGKVWKWPAMRYYAMWPVHHQCMKHHLCKWSRSPNILNIALHSSALILDEFVFR